VIILILYLFIYRLIVATSTGSTAYSLSAGGPIVHPNVQSILMTPICPRSLSFRTALLPTNSTIDLKIGDRSRSQVEVSIDGQEVFLLNKGEYVKVSNGKRGSRICVVYF
jgi:NADH kinase